MHSTSVRALFAHTPFMRFWMARLFGVTANQMLMVAVAWHMYDITSSAWDLGLVWLFQFVPALVLTLPAGHAVDHFHRGRIFALAMAPQALHRLALQLCGLCAAVPAARAR
jgi:MFS family permease